MANFYDGQDFDTDFKKEYKQKINKTTGFCLSCSNKIKGGIFCNSWCKEDYEFKEKMRKTLGQVRK